MLRNLPTLLTAALVLLCVTTPAWSAQPPPPFRIGVLYWSETIPGQIAMTAGLRAEAASILAKETEEGGRLPELIERFAGDGPEGIDRQIAQFDELIGLGVDLIVAQPTDNAALAAPLLRANGAGIPVVAYDQYISKGKLASYLTSDNHAAGFHGGEYLAHHFPDDKSIRLVLVEYPHVSSTVERVDGLLDALRQHGQPHEIVATYLAVEPVAGKKAGEAIRDKHPKGTIDAVFTVNDGGGLAVVEVLAAAGRDELVVATIDGDSKSVENILAGRLTHIDSAQFCGALGRETMKVAWQLLTGDPAKVAPHILLPVFPITAETAGHFGGWSAPPPGSLEKPWASVQPIWQWALRYPTVQASRP